MRWPQPFARPSVRRKLASGGTGGTGLALVGIGTTVPGALSTGLIVVGSVLALLGAAGWARELVRDSHPQTSIAEPTPYGPPTPMQTKLDEVRDRDAHLYRIDPAETRRIQEQAAKAAEKRADFKHYAQELAGWFKSYHPAPLDPAEILGEGYEDATGMDLVDGKITRAQYENLVRPFTERREWENRLRSDYQLNKRANVIRWLDWAKATGGMTGAEALALITAKEPRTPEDFNELVDAFERIAGRL